MTIAITDIVTRLVAEVEPMRFTSPVAHVYNPLIYARQPHVEYLERFGKPGKEILFLGMNPGPWGMGQTGIPFGAVPLVRDWLRLEGPVDRPFTNTANDQFKDSHVLG